MSFRCRAHYKRSALLRDSERLELVVPLVAGVSEVRFALALNSSLLNSWPTEPLALAGLIDPPLESTSSRGAPSQASPATPSSAAPARAEPGRGTLSDAAAIDDEVLVAEAIEVSEESGAQLSPDSAANEVADPSFGIIRVSPQTTPSPPLPPPHSASSPPIDALLDENDKDSQQHSRVALASAPNAPVRLRATVCSAASSRPLWLVHQQEECDLPEMHELPQAAISCTSSTICSANAPTLEARAVSVFGGRIVRSTRSLSLVHMHMPRPRAESSNPSLLEQSGESDVPLRVDCVFVAQSASLLVAREAAADEQLGSHSPAAHTSPSVSNLRLPLVPIEEAASTPPAGAGSLLQSAAARAPADVPAPSHTVEVQVEAEARDAPPEYSASAPIFSPETRAEAEAEAVAEKEEESDSEDEADGEESRDQISFRCSSRQSSQSQSQSQGVRCCC